MDSYDIRFWDIKKLGSGTGARFRVRWAVDGREHCRSFKARPLADGFLTELKDAVRDRRPFNPRTGLPDVEVIEDEVITWYQHSSAYTEVKWANLAPASRRSVAEALVTVTIALSKKERAPPTRACCGRRCSAGRSTPPPATPPRLRTSPPPSTGPGAHPSRSPTWKTPQPCGWRWAPAPRPWPGSRPPGRPSDVSGR